MDLLLHLVWATCRDCQQAAVAPHNVPPDAAYKCESKRKCYMDTLEHILLYGITIQSTDQASCCQWQHTLTECYPTPDAAHVHHDSTHMLKSHWLAACGHVQHLHEAHWGLDPRWPAKGCSGFAWAFYKQHQQQHKFKATLPATQISSNIDSNTNPANHSS